MNNAVSGVMIISVLITLFIVLIICGICIAAAWKIFVKAGREGWKCLIPIYNNYVLFEICGMSGLWVIYNVIASIGVNLLTHSQNIGALIFIVLLWIGTLVISIVQGYKLGRVFGKGTAYCIFSAIFPTISMLILGFGNAQWHDPDDIFDEE